MLVTVNVLLRVTLLVLILEGRWTWSASPTRTTVAPSPLAPVSSSSLLLSNGSCWLQEEYVILEECHPCTGKNICVQLSCFD